MEKQIFISYEPKKEYFAVRVHGDAMKNIGIIENSVVVAHKQNYAENDDIIIASLNGEQIIRRIKISPKAIFLTTENSDCEINPITKIDDFLILGKVVEIRTYL